jgi:predicted kinase
VFALLLTGPPGAGKSSVLGALHDSLGAAGIASAAVELDELERCYPPLPAERTIAHLRLLSESFAAAGYALLLVTATVEDDAYGAALLHATGARAHMVVRLEAEPETLRRRIVAREPARWSGLAQLVEASRTLARSMPSLARVDLVLSTEAQEAEDVAARVERALRARLSEVGGAG